MQLKTFKTLWGNALPIDQACLQAQQAGFDGIEGRAPQNEDKIWSEALAAHKCDYIAEIVSGGDYVPERNWSVQNHLDDIQRQIELSTPLNPLFATCIVGCDAWSEKDSLTFFEQAMSLEKKTGVILSFETHRSRCLFNPWTTDHIVKELPDIKLTLDMSHWCVVAERQMDTELDLIKRIAPNIFHLHGRVGYDQGPQVPDPAAPEYEYALLAHEKIWRLIWTVQTNAGKEISTFTPEFGPDGYCHLLPYTQAPVADIWHVNQWMNRREKQRFDQFQLNSMQQTNKEELNAFQS